MNQGLQKPILVMAGGTGGHVFPALAVAENLRQQGENIVWLGTRSGIEARVVPAAGFAIEWLTVQGLRGKGAITLIMAPFRLLRACWQALRLLRRLRPKAVLGMGGFVSGPGGLMAWLLNIPLFLHEQNSIVGLTNRILSRFALRNYTAFPDAASSLPRSECIGNPVRTSLADVEQPDTRLQSRIKAPLQLLVIGGSLGAAALNSILPLAPVSIVSSVHSSGINAGRSIYRSVSKTMVTPASMPRWSVLSMTCNRLMPGPTWWCAGPERLRSRN
jgi:UDP-N-acetylglucosamine--N-acetylmuramyl-(pentapeptide) pyrophosphoryl-undecaprenol N-acetylglucosamine transferase